MWRGLYDFFNSGNIKLPSGVTVARLPLEEKIGVRVPARQLEE